MKSPAFPHPLRLERTAPMKAVLIAPFGFMSPTLGPVEVEKGFDTDYASVPPFLWSLYPPDGDYTEAAVIHDALYWHQAPREQGLPITRAQADAVFLEAMAALGIPWHRRRILHAAVRVGGWKAWRANERARHAREAAEPSYAEDFDQP